MPAPPLEGGRISGMMWKCSMVIFLLPLVVYGAHPRQPALASYTLIRQREKYHTLRGDAEIKANEQVRLPPIRQVTRSSEDLLGVCDCFVSHLERSTGCSYEIGEYGPLIINGTCFNGTQRKRRRRQSVAFTNNAPIEFPDLPWCESDLPLLLVSSGEKKTLHLNNVPSVWVCPRSLGAPLQELSITDVPEIRIAPGALANRLKDFTLNITGVSATLDIPQKAFSVSIPEVENVEDAHTVEGTVEYSIFPQVNVVIVNASTVRFDSMSVSAPRVKVEVRQTETLAMETNAVKGLFSPLDSALDVSFTQKFLMGTHAAIVKRLWVTNTAEMMLREESVEVTVPGGEVHLTHIGEVIVPERSIVVGSRASLKLTNVSFTTLGHRAIHSSAPLTLLSLVNVTVTGPAHTPICLATLNLVLKNMTTATGDHSTAAACLKFSHSLEVGQKMPLPGVVLLKTSSLKIFDEPNLYESSKCALCNHQPTVVIESMPPPILLRTTASAPSETPSYDSTHPGPTDNTHTHPVTIHELEVSSGTEQSMEVESNWWEEPKYLGPAAALVLLVILLLLFCCLYSLHKRSKRAKYELPQTFRSRTFPRTIVTPDTLDAPPLHAAPASHTPAQLFVSYHVSHGPVHAVEAQHQRWHNGVAPANPTTGYWREDHHASSCHNGSLMTAEDDYSISSSEMTI